MHSLQANYDFTVTGIHYPYLKTTSKIIPLNQYKFQILNQNKEARRQPGGEYTYEQQSKSIPPCFDSSKHDAHIEYYKKFTMSSDITKRRGRNINVEQHQESAKISGMCKTIKYKKLFPRLLTLQTLADAIFRFTNIKEDRDMLEIASHGKLIEREFMDHD